MDLRKLKTLIDLVSESGISELEVNEGEDRVRIVNAGSPAPAGQVVYANPAPQHAQAAPVASAAPAAVPVVEAAPVATGSVARSPMVGTFYRAPNPESPNFVNIGDTVKIGQTLCIIEAMKLLNEIESEHAGVVKEILCENGQGVEFDQPLFIIA
ncbi:acetyl-CoA carboxylase biotin carboxyl carrier protein [Polynucleobacter asymbioticus]|uniref:Biotin carboxyl carrier protein of acetyl-CoA carboxylase n=1 Tax=Polynucleobacter asymbioticus TaxID=576611 RepID=A0AAC9ISZ8_9BURK|nr:acetyl-CoA carboxylase biotin carboxyl carrier protein [Polynucleobacter asymbioticus]APB98066.1 acetyl-CoA carboxylase biotin carboxyl carrier protein subunit [Polynucleobacter asymbioticus]APC00352.1 acetyl-CoA carboxylase biotin carboxyl carrier protein subunit [Polynucleobacter asymbioticus]